MFFPNSDHKRCQMAIKIVKICKFLQGVNFNKMYIKGLQHCLACVNARWMSTILINWKVHFIILNKNSISTLSYYTPWLYVVIMQLVCSLRVSKLKVINIFIKLYSTKGKIPWSTLPPFRSNKCKTSRKNSCFAYHG